MIFQWEVKLYFVSFLSFHIKLVHQNVGEAMYVVMVCLVVQF